MKPSPFFFTINVSEGKEFGLEEAREIAKLFLIEQQMKLLENGYACPAIDISQSSQCESVNRNPPKPDSTNGAGFALLTIRECLLNNFSEIEIDFEQ